MSHLPRILVVDDNANNRLSIRTILKGIPATVDEADNGFDALLLCLNHHYALVLLDVNMPDMNGFEVCEQLRANPHTAKTPIIFVTAAYKDIQDNLHGYAAGATDYLTKPLNDGILRAKTKIFLQLYEQQQSLIYSKEAIEHLIMGIAREINTPLGAISSSAGNLNKFLAQTITYMPTLIRGFSDEEYGYFVEILNRSLNAEPSQLSAKQQRQHRRTLVELLNDELDNPETVADSLVDMGIYDQLENIVPLLKRADGENILEVAYRLSEIKKGVQTITTATDRTAKMVFALKFYNQQNAPEKKMPIPLLDSIEGVLKLYEEKLAKVALVKDYPASLPLLACYPDDLHQVWANLLQNALHAMHYEGTLTIRVLAEEQVLCVSVQDTGRGIPCENLSKIFYPFFTTEGIGEASGLGLHIVKQIVEKHQGTIAVESVPGCTQFTVELPLNY